MKITEAENGFSLVEVLVAFAVLAGALVFSFRIFSDGLVRIHAAEQKRAAISLARRELAALQLEDRLRLGDRSRDEAGLRLSLRLTTLGQDRAEADSVIAIKTLITVAASDKSEPPLFVIESILLQRAEQ